MKYNIMFMIGLLWKLAVLVEVSQAFNIRLWPTNDEGTQGFVEAYHEGQWGFVGSPSFRFSDVTAGVFCRILGISKFGYGAAWTPLNNYYAYSWLLAGIECFGNETDAGQCNMLGNWSRTEYSGQKDWGYKYGSRLYCVDTRLVDGKTSNSGVVEVATTRNGDIYRVCHEGFTMLTAKTVCRNLGYEDALSVEPVTTTYKPRLRVRCLGEESSVLMCSRYQGYNLSNCEHAASVTCAAVRLTNLNKNKNEGIVEIFYKGSWGMVGNPGQLIDDVTAAYVCKRLGYGLTGFGVRAHHLGQHDGIAWTGSLSCMGNETNVMNCAHAPFSLTPSLMRTYRAGSWIYCFPYRVDGVRLRNGYRGYEGRVELRVNGQWGLICTHNMNYAQKHRIGKVVCRRLRYSDVAEVVHADNRGDETDLFWMSNVVCNGTESSINDCLYDKGSSYECFTSPYYLRIKCKVDEVDQVVDSSRIN